MFNLDETGLLLEANAFANIHCQRENLISAWLQKSKGSTRFFSLRANSSGNYKLKPLFFLFIHIFNPNEPDGSVKGTPPVIWTFRTKFWTAATVL